MSGITSDEIKALRAITSPSVANAIETFKVRPREAGNLASSLRCLFPEMGPMVGHAATCVIRAEHVSVSHANVHIVDFGVPVKVGGVWIAPGDLIHADQHGAVTVPLEVAARVPQALSAIEADERRIISTCQAPGFTVEQLKAVYREIRPGTY